MKLVNKPQFDTKAIKKGTAVELRTFYKASMKHTSQVDKFINGAHGLIISVEPLSLTVLLMDCRKAMIDVDDVAHGLVEIKELVVKEEE